MILFDLQDTNRVDMLVENGAVINTGTGGDMSNYYTKSQTDAVIAKAIEEVELLPGPPGPAYTLTDDDKREMVDAVIAALPVYKGEVGV